MTSRPVQLTATCLNLRHKLMYVDEAHATPGLVDSASDTRIYWCAETQCHTGPDGQSVHPDCCSGDRPCHVAG